MAVSNKVSATFKHVMGISSPTLFLTTDMNYDEHLNFLVVNNWGRIPGRKTTNNAYGIPNFNLLRKL